MIIAALMLTIAACIIVYANSEKIKSVLVSQLNTSLTTKVAVGKIDVSLFTAFPNVSMTFSDVMATDAYEGETSSDTLFAFKHLSLSFNVFDILKSDYTINRIKAQSGVFNMKIRKDGKRNFIFWKQSRDTAQSNFKMRLHNIKLKDVAYLFRNDCTHQSYHIHVINADADGKLFGSRQSIDFDGEMILKHIQVGNLVVAASLPMDIALKCDNDAKNGRLEVSKSRIKTGKMNFKAGGRLDYKTSPFIDMAIDGSKISIKELISTLPQNVRSVFKDYKSDGDIAFKARIEGSLSERSLPKITADFSIKGATLTNKKLAVKLHHINLTGKYSNGSSQNAAGSSLDISNFSARLNEGSVSGRFRLFDFNRMLIDADLTADVDLQKLQSLLRIKRIENLNGNLKCSFAAKGSVKQTKNLAESLSVSGKASLNNLNLKIKELNYALSSTYADLVFSNSAINITKLDGRLNNQPFRFAGVANNVAYLAMGNTKRLSASGNLYLAALEVDNNKTKLLLKDINTKIDLSPSAIGCNQLRCEAFGGRIDGDIAFVKDDKTGGNLFGKLNLNNVNITSVFSSFDNFGQKGITDKQIKGNLTAKADFNIAFDDKMKAKRNKIRAEVDYRIDNGALRDVELLNKLSYFVDEAALRDVRFATLASDLQILDGCITFAPLNVKSNAFGFEFLGKHYIEGKIDYHFAVSLTELASKRKKQKLIKQQQDFGTFEQNADSRLTLFVKVGGTLDKPTFSYDMKRNIEQTKKILRQDKTAITKALQNDLKIRTEQAKKDEQQWKKQSKGEWVIEWEDEKRLDSIKTSSPQKKEEPELNIEW